MIRLELMMGLDIPDEGTVTPQMFDDFIRTEIAPHLDYATIIDGVGLWKLSLIHISEPTRQA